MRTAIPLCLLLGACTAAPTGPTGTVTWSVTIDGATAGCERLGGPATIRTDVTAVLTSGETAKTSAYSTDCADGQADWNAELLQAELEFFDADAGDIDHLVLDTQLEVQTDPATTTAYAFHRSAPFGDQVALPFDLTQIQLTWQPVPTDQLGWGYTHATTWIEVSSHSINSTVEGNTPPPVHTKLGINIFDYEQAGAPLLVALESAEEVSFTASLVGYDASLGTEQQLDEVLQTALIAPTGATVALPLSAKH